MPNLSIRPARPGDAASLFELIDGLARFEKLEHMMTGSPEALARDLFGDRPAAEALLAERDGRAVGFALYFTSYSSFMTRPGLYLEDLFVVEQHRGTGIGRALMRRIAAIAAERGYARFEWSVLDWNARAIRFYETLGAEILPDWRICRVTGEALRRLGHAEPGARSGEP